MPVRPVWLLFCQTVSLMFVKEPPVVLSKRILKARFATPAVVLHVELMRSVIRVSAAASMNQSALNVAAEPCGTMRLEATSLAVPTALRATKPAAPPMSVHAPLAVAPVYPYQVIVAEIRSPSQRG